jgi:AcrR family transcriptional regulator
VAPKTIEQNKKIKDERRDQILLNALKLFARRGMAATKISDIADISGFSQGLVYHYFDSKEDIYTELLRRATSGSGEALLQMEQLPMEPLAKIEFIAGTIMERIEKQEEDAYYFLLMTQSLITEANPEAVKQFGYQTNVPFEALSRIVVEGQTGGAIREGNPAGMVMVFWAAINGLALSKLAYPNFVMPDHRILVRIFEKVPNSK